MPNDTDSTRIALTQQGVEHLQEWCKNHAQEDTVRFERTFSYVKDSFHKMDEKFDKMDTKLDTLWDEKNQAAGAFNFSKLVGGGIWAMLAVAISWFLNLPHKP